MNLSLWSRQPDGFFLLPEMDLIQLLDDVIRWKAYAEALETAGQWRE